MIANDFLFNLTSHVLVTDSWVTDLIRLTIAAIASMVALLIVRQYSSHQARGMDLIATAGAASTYMVVAWAQVIAVSSPTTPRDLTALNIGVLVAMLLSLVGVLQRTKVHLFAPTNPKPGRWSRALGQLDRLSDTMDADSGKLDAMTDTMDSNSGKLDTADHKLDDAATALSQIDYAVNNRHPVEPTISEDVRSLVDRAEAQDEAEGS